MDSFSKKLKAKVSSGLKSLASNTKETINKIKNNIEKEKTNLLSKQPKEKQGESLLFQIVEIVPRINYMPFPSSEVIGPVSDFLNKKYKENYWIWNVGEHQYDTECFNCQVSALGSPGYPCLTLGQIFLISKAILGWLVSDQKNIAFVHCQNSKGRSALLLSCLLCLMGRHEHPLEAMSYFCKLTKTEENEIMFASQKLYLRYFGNIEDGIEINSHAIKIRKIVFSDIPELNIKFYDNKPVGNFRPYIQILQNSKIVFDSLIGEKDKSPLKSYSERDLSLWFDLDMEVQGDLLIRCKHYHNENVRIPVFRIMLNTCFLFDNIHRLKKFEIDVAPQVNLPDKFFLDLMFEEEKDKIDKKHEHDIRGLANDCKETLKLLNKGYLDTWIKKKPSEMQEAKQKQQQQSQNEYDSIREIMNRDIKNTIKSGDQAKFSINDSSSASSYSEGDILSTSFDEKHHEQKEKEKEVFKKIMKELENNEEEKEDDMDDYIKKLESE